MFFLYWAISICKFYSASLFEKLFLKKSAFDGKMLSKKSSFDPFRSVKASKKEHFCAFDKLNSEALLWNTVTLKQKLSMSDFDSNFLHCVSFRTIFV